MKNPRQTYETDMPWLVWTYLTTDRRTRITGRSRIRAVCAICGHSETLTIRIPRFGDVPEPASGKHAERWRFRGQHSHPGQQDPADWMLPLLNPAAINGDLLGIFQRVADTAIIEAQMHEDET